MKKIKSQNCTKISPVVIELELIATYGNCAFHHQESHLNPGSDIVVAAGGSLLKSEDLSPVVQIVIL